NVNFKKLMVLGRYIFCSVFLKHRNIACTTSKKVNFGHFNSEKLTVAKVTHRLLVFCSFYSFPQHECMRNRWRSSCLCQVAHQYGSQIGSIGPVPLELREGRRNSGLDSLAATVA
ncbi:unnamed protein product, partial [Owenia fusiformis]